MVKLGALLFVAVFALVLLLNQGAPPRIITCKMVPAMSEASPRTRQRSRATKGRIRLLDTMADRATASTMTMAVAAENPPTKTMAVSRVSPRPNGRASTRRSGFTAGANRAPAATSGRTARLVSSR